jgi:hypothetical protein
MYRSLQNGKPLRLSAECPLTGREESSRFFGVDRGLSNFQPAEFQRRSMCARSDMTGTRTCVSKLGDLPDSGNGFAMLRSVPIIWSLHTALSQVVPIVVAMACVHGFYSPPTVPPQTRGDEATERLVSCDLLLEARRSTKKGF